jgi:diadenosine tetraphosphate (Ap4A) HIT family hydrolase
VSSLGHLAFKIALNPSIGSLVGYGFEYAAPLLPVRKLFLTPKTIVFYHPRPAWKTHYLVIPRKKIKNLFQLTEPSKHVYFRDVLLSASKVIWDQLEPTCYALIVNGGIRQDVMQVHFHLTGEQCYVAPLESTPLLETASFSIYDYTSTETKQHFVYVPKFNLLPLSKWQSDTAENVVFSLNLAELDQRFQLVKKGFSLVFQEASGLEQNQFIIHLVTGGPLQVG